MRSLTGLLISLGEGEIMAEGKTIIIGSKLPIALTLKHPLQASRTVVIRGLNDAPRGTNGQPIAVPYITTQIDAQFWAEWKIANDHPERPFKPLASGAIFEAKTEEAAKSVYRERETEKTGLEPARSSEFAVQTFKE